MKPSLLLLLGALCSGWLGSSAPAQDTPVSRAAVIAERDAAEERYKRLSSAVEDLWAAKSEQDRRLAALSEEIRNLRADSARSDSTKYVTREEFSRLLKTVEEIERKREADKKLILEQIEELKRDLRGDLKKMLSAPAPSSPGRNSKPARSESPAEKTGNKPADPPAANQEGVWHEVGERNTLHAIVATYNDEFKKQGKKTSLKLVLDANPGLKPTSMKVGQKIFVPLVPQ